MKYFDTLTRLEELIYLEDTGTAKDFADKLGISPRSLHNYIRLLKEFGAPIAYSRFRETYYYKRPGRVRICFIEKELHH